MISDNNLPVLDFLITMRWVGEAGRVGLITSSAKTEIQEHTELCDRKKISHNVCLTTLEEFEGHRLGANIKMLRSSSLQYI